MKPRRAARGLKSATWLTDDDTEARHKVRIPVIVIGHSGRR